MKTLFLRAAVMLLAIATTPAAAQVAAGTPAKAPAGFLPAGATFCSSDGGASWVPCGARQESAKLATANVPSAAVTVYGGDYILSQTCTGYGTLKLQVLGPDGTTWLDLLTKTASDSASGTGLALGSFASVRVTVSGTTGCNVILARVPA